MTPFKAPEEKKRIFKTLSQQDKILENIIFSFSEIVLLHPMKYKFNERLIFNLLSAIPFIFDKTEILSSD